MGSESGDCNGDSYFGLSLSAITTPTLEARNSHVLINFPKEGSFGTTVSFSGVENATLLYAGKFELLLDSGAFRRLGESIVIVDPLIEPGCVLNTSYCTVIRSSSVFVEDAWITIDGTPVPEGSTFILLLFGLLLLVVGHLLFHDCADISCFA